MISVTPSVGTLLASQGPFFFVDLWTFHLLNGQVLRYNSSDRDISFDGTTWLGTALRIERGKIKLNVGVQVDSLEVDCYPGPDDVVGSNPFVQLCVNGGLDGCYVQLDRGVGPDPDEDLTGLVPLRFYGRVAELVAGRSKVTLTVKSDLDLLNIQMPRTLFQAPCSHSLYDGGCTLSRAAFTDTGAVAGAATLSAFATTLTAANRYYENGVIAFTSGVNAGLTRTVKIYSNASGIVRVVMPLPKIPGVGDTFSIYPGCDKRLETCTAKFSNQQNFRGYPFVPDPSTAMV